MSLRAKLAHGERIVRFGLKNLWLHRLRSLLTILGIVFGVASVIAMLAIGEGASYEAREKIKELGSTNIIIRSVKPPDEGTSQQPVFLNAYGLLPADRRRISDIPSVQEVIPCWENEETAWALEKSVSCHLVGTLPSFSYASNIILQEGRFLQDVDERSARPVAVIGASVRAALFPSRGAVGSTLRLRGGYFTVVGVVAERAPLSANAGFELGDFNRDVYIPLETARDYFGEYAINRGRGAGMANAERSWVRFHRFIVRVDDMERIVPTAAVVNNVLSLGHKKRDYEIIVPLELLRQAEHTRRIFNIVLGSIAAISLLVGGIGIMNIMLATVTERTKEIGVRRALGARKKDIIYQFLSESVILSATGGCIGVVLGIAIPNIVTHTVGMTTVITPWSVGLSFCISVAVGIVFGLYPARQAAALDPIQALRYE